MISRAVAFHAKWGGGGNKARRKNSDGETHVYSGSIWPASKYRSVDYARSTCEYRVHA